MSVFEEQVKKGSAALREAGLIDGETEVFMPDVDMIEYVDAPLSKAAKYLQFLYIGLIMLGLLAVFGGIGFIIYSGFFAADAQDTHVIFSILYVVFMFFIVVMAGGAVMLVAQGVSIVFSSFFKGAIRRNFVRAVETEFNASPAQYLERGWMIDSYEFYALDIHAGKYFDYGQMTKWAVRAVPLSMVQRFEALHDKETTVTTELTSSNRVRTSSSSRSEYALRLHVMDTDGRPLQILVPFGSDEGHMQNWITALNAA